MLPAGSRMATAHLTESEIAAMVDGTASPADQERFEQHLDECAACLDLVAAAAADADPVPTRRAPEVAGSEASGDVGAAVNAPEQDAPLESGARIGRYLVIGPLGQGGMGVVYAAYDPELDRRVAIKLLLPSGSAADGGQARLLREAQALARISHPNVVAVHDVGTTGDRVFLAMELVEGETARAWCKREPRTWRAVLEVFVAAGRGLAAAHGAGLIHRDFKPENVLVGKDGRVRVMDFGLARFALEPAAGNAASTASADPETDPRGMNLPLPLTRAGRVMGTPQYMAPEQLAGRAVDARSDQFSFCAALYTCLFSARPFRPAALARAATELFVAQAGEGSGPGARSSSGGGSGSAGSSAAALPASPIREPPRDAGTPPWLRKVVMRGLSLSPEARYPSMDALLQELSRDARAVRRRWTGAVAAVAVAALAVPVALSAPSRKCREPEKRLAGIWDATVKASAERSFQGNGKAYVRASWAKVHALVDAYAGRWAQEHQSACEALAGRTETRVEAAAARMVCLERRLLDLRAVTELLVAPRENALDRAVDAVEALRPVEPCQRAGVAAGREAPGAADDPQARADAERISALLAQAKALLDSGQYKQGLEIARAASGLAERASQRGLEAEALDLGGWLQVRLGQVPEGEAQLRAAAALALSSQRDDVLASAAVRLVYAVGYLQNRPELAEQWVLIARAATERIGGERGLEVDLLNYLGALEQIRGNGAAARQRFEEADRAAATAFGPEHPKRAMVLTSLAHAEANLGKLDASATALREALRVTEAAYSPHHPSLAYPLMAMADVLRQQKDYEGSLRHLSRALEIRQAALGPDHRDVSEVLEWIGLTQLEAGRPGLAGNAYLEALAIKQRALPADHPDLVWTYKGLGASLLKAGKPEDAVDAFTKAVALRPENPELRGDVTFHLAKALRKAHGEARKVREAATAARADYAKAGATHLVAEVDQFLAGK